MSKNVTQPTFQSVVQQTPDISKSYKSGLSAIRTGDRKSLQVKEPRSVDGSVDIDSATKQKYPTASRWDYVIGYKQKAYFVEVHPANTSNVAEMEAKLKWLQTWLRDHATILAQYPAGTPKFLWAATKSGIHILKTSPEYRKVASLGLIPKYPQTIE